MNFEEFLKSEPAFSLKIECPDLNLDLILTKKSESQIAENPNNFEKENSKNPISKRALVSKTQRENFLHTLQSKF